MQNNLSKTFYKRLKKYILYPSKTDYTKKRKVGHKFSNNIAGKFVNDKLKIYLLNKHHKYIRTFETAQEFFSKLKLFDKDGVVRSYFILNNLNESTVEFELTPSERIIKMFEEVVDMINNIGLGDLMG